MSFRVSIFTLYVVSFLLFHSLSIFISLVGWLTVFLNYKSLLVYAEMLINFRFNIIEPVQNHDTRTYPKEVCLHISEVVYYM